MTIKFLLAVCAIVAVPQWAHAQCYQNGVPCGSGPTGSSGSSGSSSSGLIYGTDGTNNYPILTDSNGRTITNINSLPALSSGTNTIGSIASITNPVAVTQSGPWSLSLTGNLPAFATTPTFNFGSLNGAATDSSLQSIKTVLGSPLQAGGTVTLGAGTNAIGTVSLTNGTATIGNILRSTAFNETTTALGANATFTASTARDSGAVGSASTANVFSCFVRADQSGTLYQQASNDNNTWYTELSGTISANVSVVTTGRVFTRYHRCQVVNGNTAQTTLIVNSQLGE